MIEVGDKIAYKYKGEDGIIEEIIIGEGDICALTQDDIEILKIERPNWTVVEEKKDLLTEEEKEFLKQIFKFKEFNSKVNYISFNGYRIEFMESAGIVIDYMFIKKRIFRKSKKSYV